MGYAFMHFSIAGEVSSYFVHRLVGFAFIENPLKHPEINHKDGNPLNNNVSNLEWVTKSENHIHRCRVLKHYPLRQVGSLRGEDHGKAKLTDADVRCILAEVKGGVSHRALAKRFDVHPTNISCIVRGLTWTHIPREGKA